ncbi:hypothetical protein, conserved [Eimeria brunetti]|uniref:ISP1 C-terminal domain-containing protein n=1 Tax=Eimeria brunetti TaxID=51314 RepID=U6L5X4_9EIME|nr:hypothetical protein, conserved [Eimeria brunetti]
MQASAPPSKHLGFRDKSRLQCWAKLRGDNSALELSCEKKSRTVEVGAIKSLLHTPQQLQRVDGSAGITPEDFCVALHLSASGNCIPFFFGSLRDKNLFVLTVAKIRRDGPQSLLLS